MRTSHVSAIALVLGVLVGIAMYATRPTRATKQEPVKKDFIREVPEIKSCVSSIRLVKAEIQNIDKPNATVAVEVENIGELGITAIGLTSTKGQDSYTVTLRTEFDESKEPTVVIEPHKTATLTMEVANVHKGRPLVLSSVMYVDGTDEGCSSARAALKQTKAHEEAQVKARAKGERPQ